MDNTSDRSHDSAISREVALLAAIRAGDPRALQDIVTIYAPSLYRFAHVRTRDSQLAEEVVQDVFVSLWERRDELDIRGTLKHYLFQAVRYRAINVVQRERSQERIRQSFTWELPSRIRESQNTGPDIVEFEEAMHEVSTALAALPARTREIFMLRQGQGMSAEEIAEILKIGVPSVYNQISRATKAIKTALERWQRGA